MNIQITTFTNPFSFFCVNEDYRKYNNDLTLESDSDLCKNSINTSKIANLCHGQVSEKLYKQLLANSV